MKFIKKAIPVDAIQWFDGDRDSHPAVREQDGHYYIPTLENQKLYLTDGCWIVGPGAKGEYWPVDEQVFAMTYELYQ